MAQLKDTTITGDLTVTGDITTAPIISTGTAAPSSTPNKVGDIYIDTSNLKLYFAAGTTDSDDWIIAN